MNTNLIDCYFCDYSYDNVDCKISSYNGIMICYSCKQPDIFNNIKINIINNIKCPICFENKNGIKLPNCNHKICIDCCKSIYFGYNSDKKPKCNYKDQPNVDDFYHIVNDDIENDEGRQKLDEYLLWEYNNIDYENSLEDILQKRDKLKLNRPKWMNHELFIDYENGYIQDCIEITKIEKEFDEWIDNKQKNIRNKSCPFCRK
jgi:hypothetical protein